MSDNFEKVMKYYFPDLHWASQVYMAILTVPLIFLNWIRNLKLLAPVSFITNVLQIFNIIVVFYYIFQDVPSVTHRPAFGSWGMLPLYFGTAVYTFEGIGLVLPLQKDMQRPRDFMGLTGLLNTGMVIVTILYMAVGFYGYLKYGSEIEASITLNFPDKDL